ncbi:alkaline phosphatase family protein [Occallatibacter savannae]|uniref:alkaline phosphatase family protein n=1 Tax=Occallatibacter savannae TaxID=1002691 RepID=UPI0019509F9B|nr:alkaline phosphatase family protein [Occallatibacter savannae]
MSALLLALSTGFTYAQTVPRSSHVWIITEENHSYEDVVGNTQMPYYNELIKQYGLATQFYANQHSSLPALMWFVAGAPVELNNDTTSCAHMQDNVVRELLKSGYKWKTYQENMPYAGFQGVYGGTNNLYYRRHNPLIDFSDVCPGTGQDIKSVPYTQLATDIANNATPNYIYITPDSDEDAHNGTLSSADQWLQDHVPAILARPEFAPGGDGILFILWDEGTLYTDNRCSSTVSSGCGGRTANLVIGPQVKAGYKSTITYHNQNVLKTICAVMGLSTCPGAAATAAPMADFFKSATTPSTSGIIISTPGNGSVETGSVRFIASASESKTVSQTQVWDNGKKLGVYGTDIDAVYSLAPGTHTTTVVDYDSSYNPIHQASVTHTVQAAIEGVQIISPTPSEVFNMTTVHVVAHATESVPISQVQVWDNGHKLGRYLGADVNQYYNLSPGSHYVTVLDLDQNYNVLHRTNVSYSVQ